MQRIGVMALQLLQNIALNYLYLIARLDARLLSSTDDPFLAHAVQAA